MPLPTTKRPPIATSPKNLLLIGLPKQGKTTALAQLDNALHLDFENGADFISALSVKVLDIFAPKDDSDVLSRQEQGIYYLDEVVADINKNNKEYKYKYLIVDTVSKLEDISAIRGLQLYKQSPTGKNFKGNDVLVLPNGAGYFWMRKAFNEAVTLLESTGLRLIYVGHIKTSSINKDGKDINETDVDLTGKIKADFTYFCDAIGVFIRKGNKCYIDFEPTDEVKAGARSGHLENKKLWISEMITKENGEKELLTYWDKIYID